MRYEYVCRAVTMSEWGFRREGGEKRSSPRIPPQFIYPGPVHMCRAVKRERREPLTRST